MTTQNQNIIQCRAAVGTRLPSKQWVCGESVSFLHMPGGFHALTAGFREHDRITICVDVDEDTPALLQESFDHLTATTGQEPFGDEDHQNARATLRFPAGQVSFTWGTLHGVPGVLVSGAVATSWGAEAVNGKIYRSWSPEFTTDADLSAAVCTNGHWTFPDFVRGSATNPAKIQSVAFCIGALTNKPAFRAMPPVKAKQADAASAILDALERQAAAVNEILDRLAAEEGEPAQ